MLTSYIYIYINIQAIKIYYINPLVGIGIGCEYADNGYKISMMLLNNNIIIYHDLFPPSRRGCHVKLDDVRKQSYPTYTHWPIY